LGIVYSFKTGDNPVVGPYTGLGRWSKP